MKTVILFIVLLVLAGCGDNSIPRTAYQVGIGMRDAQTEENIMRSCGVQVNGFVEGTGMFRPDIYNAYLPPVIKIEASQSELTCYQNEGSYDYITFSTP